MRPDTLGLGPFLERLEERLAALSAEQLRAALLDDAARLPAADRPRIPGALRAASRIRRRARRG